MGLKRVLVFLLLLVSVEGNSQIPELSPLSKISLLTVGTADELHSKFGHSAIRIQDPTRDMDIVFGYGGFDFETPFFYWKFARGKLDYTMTGHRYPNFVQAYKQENRWVREQQLNLSQQERNNLFQFLNDNYREENRNYKYDFLFDNCATKIPEVFKSVFGESLSFDGGYLNDLSTFRELIHETLNVNSWSAFGIDLALGSVIDRKATAWEHQFLPLYVSKQFEHTQINGKNLVPNEQLLLDARPIEKSNNFLLTPLFWSSALMFLVFLITILDQKNNKRTKVLDFALFFTTGIAGILIFFLWFMTDHTATANNFNILWAFPLNLGLAFLVGRKKSLPQWISKYLLVLSCMLLAVVFLWILQVQIFSPVIIPILLALGIRYVYLYLYSRKQIPNSYA
jgi:hypothetical protein